MRKTFLLTGLAALTLSVPAMAEKPEGAGKPAQKPATAQGPKSGKAKKNSAKRCKVHKKAYVVRGTLVSHTLVLAADGKTASGDVVVKVTKVNNHAKADKGKDTTYTLTNVRIAVEDTNKDGKGDLADVAAGDLVKLIGKVTFRHKKCTGDFTATKSFKKLSITDPKPEPAPAAPAPAPAS